MIREAYAGKRVFVTGHTGFKGSWLTQWLALAGAHVTGYALEPYTDRDQFVVAGVEDLMTRSIIGDVRDAENLAAAILQVRPDIVFHLAAQPIVRYSYEHPAETFEVNVTGTAHVLDAARACDSVAAAVVITSDKCYRNNEWEWGYRENDVLGGHDPYSASKACAELLSSSYRDSFFAPAGRALATTRAGNVIGGGDWATDRIVPDIVRALEDGQPVGVRNPASTRPWQHVLEPLGGYLMLGARMLDDATSFSEAWNFGPDADAVVPVGDLVDAAVSAWGSGSWEHTGEAGAVHEAGLLALECAKARRRLGWSPALSVNDAVAWTMEWYRGRLDGADMREVSSAQIAEYERRIAEVWRPAEGVGA